MVIGPNNYTYHTCLLNLFIHPPGNKQLQTINKNLNILEFEKCSFRPGVAKILIHLIN